MKQKIVRWFICRDIPRTESVWSRKHVWKWTRGTEAPMYVCTRCGKTIGF